LRAALYRESGFVQWLTPSEIDLNKFGVSRKRTTVEQDRRPQDSEPVRMLRMRQLA